MNNNDIYKIFECNVRRQREALGMTQEQLAFMVGVDSRTIGAIESGQRNTTIKTLYRLCKALEVTVVDLLPF